jgi:hypothetical protein
VLSVFDRDFLCVTASIYWLTGTIATSLRLYAEIIRLNPAPLVHDGRRRDRRPDRVPRLPERGPYCCHGRSPRSSRTFAAGRFFRGAAISHRSSSRPFVVEELRAFFRPRRREGGRHLDA